LSPSQERVSTAATRTQGIHRLPVLDGDGKLIGVLSQSDIIKQVAKQAGECLGAKLQQTPRELGMLKPVRTVPETESAINAFLYLHATGLPALGVVDKGTRHGPSLRRSCRTVG
jgi:CBS domain-containing protein